MKILFFLTLAIFVFAVRAHHRDDDEGLYEPCDSNDDCKNGLKCSSYVKLCVTQKCYDQVDPCFSFCGGKVDDCPDENTYKAYSNCGCCSKCEKYLQLGDECSHGPDAQKCAPGLDCCRNTDTCQELHKRKG